MKYLKLLSRIAPPLITFIFFIDQIAIRNDREVATFMISMTVMFYLGNLIFYLFAPALLDEYFKNTIKESFFFKNGDAPMYISTVLLVIIIFIHPAQNHSLQIGYGTVATGFIIGGIMKIKSSRITKSTN